LRARAVTLPVCHPRQR